LSSPLSDGTEGAIKAGAAPRRDHIEFCRSTGAELTRLYEQRPWLLRRLRPRHPLTTLWITWKIFRQRRRHDLLIVDSEHIGLALGVLLRIAGGPQRLIVVVHRVSTRLKSLLIRHLVGAGVDCYVFHFEACDAILAARGVPPERRRHLRYTVDTRFWSPLEVQQNRQICAVGLEFRDYPTLVEAVRGVDVRVEIAAASPWSHKRANATYADLPENVHLGRYGYLELRQLYAESLFTVVPLLDNDMQAGITTIVETMAMGRPVIVTRTAGQVGTVIPGITGLEVAPGDIAGLRMAILRLMQSPGERARMGAAGRRRVEDCFTIEAFVDGMRSLAAQSAVGTR
jgi:glycosyltransferase involved in cell wall biosynthesis